jgi:hypothetical protein
MAASLRSARFISAIPCSRSRQLKSALAALLFALPLLCAHLSAQTTTPTTVISGTVYDPRTTSSALPLPNVLVYVTTGPVAPPAAGVQCLTSSNSTPTGVIAYTYTAVDGTFTLGNVPVNGTYNVVIQAGKWQRQFSETVGANPLTGLVLNMPSTHLQGNIPRFAISTGQVDALECVLLDMGIAQSEFSDDNGDPNGVLPIHLYKGSKQPGAAINGSSPTETTLMASPTLMNSYDVLMFPCQATASGQANATPNGPANLFAYANAGGRVFATHFSDAWLDPAPPYNSLFPPVANWVANIVPDYFLSAGLTGTVNATINTGFTDGATLAQWLSNIGGSATFGHVLLIQAKNDLNDQDPIIPPTQPWLTLGSGTYDGTTITGTAVMQFTFNAPVGAPAANQCGRVLFNEYHVEAVSNDSGEIFPKECLATGAMNPQEEMLEYALFDLSSFVTPVVVPTLSIGITPSPLIVKQGDTNDQVTVNVTNTSATTEIYSSVVLTLTLPPGLTATAITDSTGGWICTVGTLTCTRTTSMAASASDSVTLTMSVPAYGAGSTTTGTIVATASSPNFSSSVTGSDNVIFQQPPPITWATPNPIVYGVALSGTQLDATSTIAGSFSYSPAAGTVLNVGPNTLTATFTPTDTTDYTTSTASVVLTVEPVTPGISLTSNANPVFMANAVTFTATIGSFGLAPTGTVAFYDGTTQIGTGTVTGGVASFTTTALSNAVHSITAVYSGDSSYGPASGGPLSENVEDFTIVPSNGGSVTVPASALASFPLVITPVGGTTLPGAISFAVTGLSLGATGQFSPATVSANSAATTVTLDVQLPGSAAAQPHRRPFSGGALPLALSLILLPFAGRLRKASRRWKSVAVLALLGIGLAIGLNGCGGSTAAIKAQGYSLTVTATSGGLSHTATVSLTVQ